MKIIYSDEFLEHRGFRLPETRARLISITNCLKKEGFCGDCFVEPKPAKEEDMLLVHDKGLLQDLKLRSERLHSTPDNPFNENTYNLALLSAGAALDAARFSKNEFAFSLARPPGHHAGIYTFGGFCYLNNIAFAVRKLQKEAGIKRALVIDFDVHLGQGTLEIFQDDPSVFYLSLHQDPRTIYPWRDFGKETDTVKKVHLVPDTTDKEFLEKFREAASQAVESFKPELIAVSAGFDVFHEDSMVGSRLAVTNPETFFEVGKIIKGFKTPAFGVLEGGYSLGTLGGLVYNFLRALK